MIDTQIRPFLIGISGGSNSGKIRLMSEVSEALKKFNICKINLICYYKALTEEQMKDEENYNFDCPDAFDFDLLLNNIESLRNGKPILIRKYDRLKKDREKEMITINPSPVIIFEGIFAFYDKRIRNLMDLKIFIDTDCDVRLTQRICRDLSEQEPLEKILLRYHKFIKPGYDNYIAPTKKYSDIIIPRGLENKQAIVLVSEYLKVQLDKLHQEYAFSSINEVIDPKYMFFDKKILVCDEKSNIEFIQSVFEDTINNKHDIDFTEDIRERMITILSNSLIDYLRNKASLSTNLPKIDLLLTEYDDITGIDFNKYKIILYFKTLILTEEDMKIPEAIQAKAPNRNLIICSIFISPKFGELLLNRSANHLMLDTLYFSDFFIKFEQFLRKDNVVFDSKELSRLFYIQIQKFFNYKH